MIRSTALAPSAQPQWPAGALARGAQADLPRRTDSFALLSAAIGLASLAPLWPPLRALMLAVFILTGPGLAVVTWMRLQRTAEVVAVPVIGLSAMTGFTAVFGWLNMWVAVKLWAPVELVLAMVAGVLVSALVHAWQTGSLAGLTVPAIHLKALRRNGALILIIIAIGSWTLLLPGMSNAQFSDFGLLFAGTGPGLVLIVAAVVLAFAWALGTSRLVTAAVAIAAVIVVQRATPSLITDVPIYSWTYPHLGVVDYIQRYQMMPPRGIDVYSEWPAFFTAFAWFGDVTALAPLTIAHWFAPVIHGLLAVLIGGLAMLLGLNVRQALAAAMFAELVNWVGQDFFAPQALALVLAVGVLALLASSITYPPAGVLALLAFEALIATHQLTPYWLLGAIVVLTIARVLDPWWVPLPYAALLIGYLIPRMYVVLPYGLFSGTDPLESGAIKPGWVGSVGKLFTLGVWRVLTVAVVLLAMVCVVVWFRRGWPYRFPTIIALSPFPILFIQNYGGEAIFRVYLYALPGCAILIAPVLLDGISGVSQHLSKHPAIGSAPRHLRAKAVLATLGLVIAGVAGLQSQYGTWFRNVVYPSQLAFSKDLLSNIHGPAEILSVDSTGFPSRPTADYVELARYNKDFDYRMGDRWLGFADGFPTAGQFDAVTAYAESIDADTYFVFSAQGRRELARDGIISPAAMAQFEDQFGRSQLWSLRMHDENTTIYEFRGSGTDMTSAPNNDSGSERP